MFITLEGIDRSGKTTQAAMLHDALGPQALLLREPGGTELGERLRELLKEQSVELGTRTELLLFCAARAELCARVIGPATEHGRDVVCDRFIDSTVAYQGIAQDLGVEVVEEINRFAVDGRGPDLTLLIRIDSQEAARRGQQRLERGEEDGTDRFEARGEKFQREVAAAYDEIAARNPDRIVVIDGIGSPEEVHERVLAAVEARR